MAAPAQERSRKIEQIQDDTDDESSPLSEKIRNEPLPVGFQLFPFDTYDGTTDPEDHLYAVKSILTVQKTSDALMCQIFATTFRGRARCWFSTLPAGSITSFKALSQAFLARFICKKRMCRGICDLMCIKQREGESLKEYVARFNDVALDVNPFFDDTAVIYFQGGLLHEPFSINLIVEPTESFAEVNRRAEWFIRTEERDRMRELDEKESEMSREYQYQGGIKKRRAGNSNGRNW